MKRDRGQPEPSELQVHIDSLAVGGDGVGRDDGRVVFVRGALPGEDVVARITEAKRSFARGETAGIIASSPFRVAPSCPVYGTCGGCNLQHAAISLQRDAKTAMVRDTLVRIGHVASPQVEPCRPSPDEWRYRRIARFAVEMRGDTAVLGFRRLNGRDVVQFDACPLLRPLVNRTLDHVRRCLHGVPGRILCELREVVIRATPDDAAASVLLITESRGFQNGWTKVARKLMERVQSDSQRVQGVAWRWQPPHPHAQPPHPVSLAGDPCLAERYGDGYRFASAGTFGQANALLIPQLIADVVAAAELTGEEVVMDAYCGAGLFSLALAPQAAQVIGIEVDLQAVEDARRAAREQGICNAVFLCSGVDKGLKQWLASGPTPTVLVLDPPRTGCSPGDLRAIVQTAPQRIVFVACDPATFARDVRVFMDAGYELGPVRPYDMFPQTSHVEVMARLTRR